MPGLVLVVLSRYSGGEPFLLNLTHFQRPAIHPRVSEVVGDFTNVLLLACRPQGGIDFRSRSKSLQQQVRAHMEHAEWVNGVEVLRRSRSCQKHEIRVFIGFEIKYEILESSTKIAMWHSHWYLYPPLRR